jgi:hypothetical protein
MRQPTWYGRKGLGSNRFVGRILEFWKLHSALFANDMAVITAQSAPGHAQVRAMGGMGKSLLAEEYALRFGAAFPGGIFVLKGTVDRDDQIDDFAAQLGLETRGLDAAKVHGHLERKLREQGRVYLWLVDDLPGALSEEERRRWTAPNAIGKTLITTRIRNHGATGGVIDLAELGSEEGYELLTKERHPEGEAEERAARELVVELGRHALAIDVAGGALFALRGQRSFEEFLDALRNPSSDALELAGQLGEELPNGHERSIAATLSSSIELLDDVGRDLLSLACVLAPETIPHDLVAQVFGALGMTTSLGAGVFLNRVVTLSLADRSERGYAVHSLITRTMRFRAERAPRTAWIRDIAIRALLEILPEVGDARSHARLNAHVAHARHLAKPLDQLEQTQLALWVATHDYERGAYAMASAHQRSVLEARRRLLGDEHPATLTARNNLAQTLKSMSTLPPSQPEAIWRRPFTLSAIWRAPALTRKSRWRVCAGCSATNIQTHSP